MNFLKAITGLLKSIAIHFQKQHCMRMATALSFQTLLALIPLVVLAFSLLTYVDAFYSLQDDIIFFLFENFLPATIAHAYDIIQDIVLNARELSYFGAVGLAITALLLFLNIETCFAQIWQAETTRNIFKRLFAYAVLLIMGPVALSTSLTLVKWVTSLSEQATGISFAEYLGYFKFLMPFLVSFIPLAFLYIIMPTRKVKWTHAAIGASIAASMFVAGKYFFKLYLLYFPSYEAIYGALAILPLFLIWLYFCWILVLLGGTITAVLGFNYTGHMKKKILTVDVQKLPEAKH